MLSDVRSYYGFVKDFGQAGYFETGQSQQIVRELSYEIRAGKLVTLSGIVGCGKTTMLRRIQDTLYWLRVFRRGVKLSGSRSWYGIRSYQRNRANIL
jgi:ABC-type glutathione transport system ATPase component